MTPAGSSPSDLNLSAIIFAGGMAGVAMWAIAIPPDVGLRVLYLFIKLIAMQIGVEIPYTICPNWDVLRVHGLREEDDCGGWYWCVMERFWTCYGSSRFKCSFLIRIYAYFLQAFPANAATFVSILF